MIGWLRFLWNWSATPLGSAFAIDMEVASPQANFTSILSPSVTGMAISSPSVTSMDLTSV